MVVGNRLPPPRQPRALEDVSTHRSCATAERLRGALTCNDAAAARRMQVETRDALGLQVSVSGPVVTCPVDDMALLVRVADLVLQHDLAAASEVYRFQRLGVSAQHELRYGHVPAGVLGATYDFTIKQHSQGTARSAQPRADGRVVPAKLTTIHFAVGTALADALQMVSTCVSAGHLSERRGTQIQDLLIVAWARRCLPSAATRAGGEYGDGSCGRHDYLASPTVLGPWRCSRALRAPVRDFPGSTAARGG